MSADVQARVSGLLEGLVESGRERGLQVAAYLDGEPIVDAHAGWADRPGGRPPGSDSLIHSFSTGKGFTATLVRVLAERGLIDYDTPIAHYWPEVGAHGKERATVRHLLSPQRLALAADVAVEGEDLMLRGRYTRGLGYFLGLPEMAGDLRAFGHHGSGGSIAFADRGRGLTFCLTRTRLVAGAAATAARMPADEIRSAVTPANGR